MAAETIAMSVQGADRDRRSGACTHHAGDRLQVGALLGCGLVGLFPQRTSAQRADGADAVVLTLGEVASSPEQQGVVHGELVSGAVEFHERDVREVITPRPRIRAIPAQASLQEALRIVVEAATRVFPCTRTRSTT